MRVMVTGGAGFIGSHLVEYACKTGHEVVVVDDLSNGSLANIKQDWWDDKACKFIQKSVTSLSPQDMEGVQVVFHEACVKCQKSFAFPAYDLHVNAQGTMRVGELAAQVGALMIHASTGSVYGKCDGLLHEDQLTNPVSWYGVSKLAAEKYLAVLKQLHGLKYVAFRYFHVYGPRQSACPKTGGVIPIFITKLLKGEPVNIHGDGTQTRYFTFVGDVVKANFWALEHFQEIEEMGGQVFNLAREYAWQLKDALDLIARKLGIRPQVNYLPPRQGDIKDFWVSCLFLESRGFSCKTNLGVGLDATIKYYRDLPAAENSSSGGKNEAGCL